jgi:ribosomal protein S18 acetylase RimI-like enzyme
MLMNMTIREALPSDFDQVGRVFAEDNQFHAALLPEQFRIAKPIITHEWFDEILANTQKAMLVAEHGHAIVGVLLINIRTNPDDPIFQPRRYAYIVEVAVAERHRGQGIGQSLMKEAHTWAGEQGATDIELNVWELNQLAIAFYEKLGYTTILRKMTLPIDLNLD